MSPLVWWTICIAEIIALVSGLFYIFIRILCDFCCAHQSVNTNIAFDYKVTPNLHTSVSMEDSSSFDDSDDIPYNNDAEIPMKKISTNTNQVKDVPITETNANALNNNVPNSYENSNINFDNFSDGESDKISHNTYISISGKDLLSLDNENYTQHDKHNEEKVSSNGITKNNMENNQFKDVSAVRSTFNTFSKNNLTIYYDTKNFSKIASNKEEDILEEIEEIENDAKRVAKEIDNFDGIENDMNYLDLNQQFIQCMIALSKVHCEKEDLKTRRTEVYEYIQLCIDKLKRKASSVL